MSDLRYSELKYDGKTYTEQWQIDEILIKNKFNWMVNAEIKNARLEIYQDTLVWNAGIWYNGDWYFGVWRDGEWKYGTWQNGVWRNGTWRDGTFKSGIIYKGRFFKGKMLDGEIRGGQFIDMEISPNVIEYTEDEYQEKKQVQSENGNIETTKNTQIETKNAPLDKVRVSSTKTGYQQMQAQQNIQQESFKIVKTFEFFNFSEKKEKDEKVNSIFDDIKNTFNISNLTDKYDGGSEFNDNTIIYKTDKYELTILFYCHDYNLMSNYFLFVGNKEIDCSNSLKKKIYKFFREKSEEYKKASKDADKYNL